MSFFEAFGFPKAFKIIFLSFPLDLVIARTMGRDFLPSLKSLPTGFLVIFESPITPIRSSVIWNAIPRFLPNEDNFEISSRFLLHILLPLSKKHQKVLQFFSQSFLCNLLEKEFFLILPF